MNLALILLSFSYSLALAIIVFFLRPAASKNRIVVTGVFIILPVLYTLQYFGLKQALGWPIDTIPPSRFEILQSYVLEPDGTSKDSGGIYFWIVTSSEETPRAFKLNYSQKLHEVVQNYARDKKSGEKYIGEIKSLGHDHIEEYQLTVKVVEKRISFDKK